MAGMRDIMKQGTTLADLLQNQALGLGTGKINWFDLPEVSPLRQEYRTQEERTLESLPDYLERGGITGPGAGMIAENIGQTAENQGLNLAKAYKADIYNRMKQGEQYGENYADYFLKLVGATSKPKEPKPDYLSGALSSIPIVGNIVGGLTGSGTSGMKMANPVSGAVTGGGCILFTETRIMRDKLFPEDSYLRKGYKKMARHLVPFMRKSNFIKSFVRAVITKPITTFAQNENPAFIPICVFWCLIWDLYGRI
jgi:hypothetical protein